jgi:hypothetical protein
MDVTDLTTGTLADLRKPRPFPAVSLLMPTHRTEPDNMQDSVRLRNVVGEAKRRLETDPNVSRDARYEVSAQLDRAVTEVDLLHSLDGLLVLAAPGEHQVWSLPRPVPERVVLSDTFLTRNLVAARAQYAPYWVLALAIDRATLWSGSGDRLTESDAGGFPRTPMPVTWDPEDMHRVGDSPSVYRGERTMQFMREVDAALQEVLAADPRPYYLAGLPPVLAALDEARAPGHPEAGRVTKGGLTNGPGPVLAQELWPVVHEHDRDDLADLRRRVDDAIGRKLLGTGLDEVWSTVLEGRVGTLLLEEGYRETVAVEDEHLVPVPEGTPSNGVRVVDDIVDDVVEQTLERGGQVRFVPDGELASRGRIAALLRY